jgi:quercetin dioxygenase-like cupin family protein
MGSPSIFHIAERDLQWETYGDGAVRYKALTTLEDAVPPMQYVEYAAGHTDPVHHHGRGEVIVVTDGELWVDEAANGPGSVVFVAARTDYAFRAGDEGARFFRIVV